MEIIEEATDTEDTEEEIDTEDIDEIDNEIEDDDFDFSELDEEEDILDFSEALESKKEAEKKINEKKSIEATPKPDMSALDYDLILDPTISQAIQTSLANTPHEGFKPVVSVSKNGNLKIDFVPI